MRPIPSTAIKVAILQGYFSKTNNVLFCFFDNSMREQSLKFWVGAGLSTQLCHSMGLC